MRANELLIQLILVLIAKSPRATTQCIDFWALLAENRPLPPADLGAAAPPPCQLDLLLRRQAAALLPAVTADWRPPFLP